MEEKFREIFEKSPIGIIFLDKKGNLTGANPSTLKIMGYTSLNDITGLNIFNDPYIAPKKDELLENGHIKIQSPIDFDNIKKSGIYKSTRSGTAYLDLTISIINSGFLGQIQDITEQKKAEVALEESEKKFLNVFHVNPGAIAILKPEGPILEVNNEFINLTGYRKDEIIGRSSVDLNLVRAEFREKLYNKMQEKGSCHNLELEIQTKSGEKRVVLNTIENIEIKGEKRILSIFFDITERKKLEEELRHAHYNLEKQVEERTKELEKLVEDLKLKEYLLDSANDSIFLHDLEGNIIYVNDAAYKSRGYTKEELLSMNIQDLSPPEFNEEIDPQINEIQKYGELIFESADLHKNGSIILIEIHSRIIKLDGKPFILSVVHDITEKKKAEKQLKETIKELERSNQELQQFAYVSSHDLQEPLRTIASFTQLLEKRYKGKFDSDADEFMDFIVEAAIRMKTQIEGLLEYSRVATKGKDFKPVDMNEILNITLQNLDTLINESKANMIIDELPVMNGDASQLQRVFQNLISNAIKFRKYEKPPIINISCNKDLYNKEYVFSIKDNGIGIEEQYSERIFTIFQRLHTREVYKGTGIGLSIVKRIIERHGGRIWVESVFGEGSTFYFTLPTLNE